MKFNAPGQQFHVIAFNALGRVSGEEENITCQLQVDSGNRENLATNVATEIGTTGEYTFDLSQAETNGHALSFVPVCSTPGVQVLGVPSNVIYTTIADPATETKQDEALAAIQGSRVIQVASPNVEGKLILTQGDTYDGVGNPKAQWVVTTDYTDGWAVTLTIRDQNDAVIYSTAGVVASASLITVDLVAPTGLTMGSSPPYWKGKFDVQLTKDTSIKTIALGSVYIYEDVTRE